MLAFGNLEQGLEKNAFIATGKYGNVENTWRNI